MVGNRFARYAIAVILLTGASIAFAQFPETLWTYQLLSQCYGSAACADIDGDGFLEIVFGTYFDDEHAYALNAENGTLKWRFDVGGGPLDAAPVIANVDLDGSLEVVIPASWGIVYCLAGDGRLKWRYPRSGYIECIDSPPSVADVDGDGLPEVIFGAWYGRVYVLNGEDGSLLWRRTYVSNGYVQSEPCILDCDGDGRLDIVIGMFRGDSKVYALRGHNGDTIWTYQAADWMYHGPATADIDLDGLPEVVIGDYSGAVFALNAENGTRLWQRTIGTYVFPPVTIAELVASSPGPEILAATNTLYCLSASGNMILWQVPTGGTIERGAVVAEIDGDPMPEVVIGSADRSLRVVNGENGSLVWRYDLPSGYPIGSAPIVADFDNDGGVDIFCVGGRGYSDTIPNYGRAFALRAGPGGGPIWTMFRHDRYRSGYQLGGPTGVEEITSAVASRLSFTAFPNPFNDAVMVEYELAEANEVTLSVYDLLGKCVKGLFEGQQPAGHHAIQWQAKDCPSGVYFLCFQVGGHLSVNKVTLLK